MVRSWVISSSAMPKRRCRSFSSFKSCAWMVTSSAVRLADLLFDGMQRVERGHRLLEHHGDAPAAHAPEIRFAGTDQLLAGKFNAAAGPVPRWRIGQQLQDRQRGNRFARARFADQRQRLALVQAEGDPLHRLDGAWARAEEDREVTYFHKRHQPPPLRGSKASRTASPTKISRLSIKASTKKAVRPSQGAWRLFLPCAKSSPSEGEPGGRPNPR